VLHLTVYTFNILLNGSSIQWVNKLKYLGCYFSAGNCAIDMSVVATANSMAVSITSSH